MYLAFCVGVLGAVTSGGFVHFTIVQSRVEGRSLLVILLLMRLSCAGEILFSMKNFLININQRGRIYKNSPKPVSLCLRESMSGIRRKKAGFRRIFWFFL
jgi:hypothetical protein